MKITVGDKWAGLECVDQFRDEVVIKSRGVMERYQDWFISLRCVCGETKVMVQREFPGKRRMLDCGCGKGVQVKEDAEATILSLYIPVATARRIRMYANSKGVSVSKGVVELVEAMLGQMEE